MNLFESCVRRCQCNGRSRALSVGMASTVPVHSGEFNTRGERSERPSGQTNRIRSSDRDPNMIC